MPIAQVNGMRVHCVQLDDTPPGGPPPEDLVMVHGLATNMAFWYFQYAPVFAKRFRVTLYDLRGHGRSEMPLSGYQPHALGDELLGLMDSLGIARAHVMAHSYGGVVAMNLAVRAPERVRSLVLADSHIAAVRHTETPQDWIYGQAIQPLLDRHGLTLDTRDPYFGYRLLTEVAQLQLRQVEVPAELLSLVSPLMGKQGTRTAAQWLKLVNGTRAFDEMMSDDGLSLERLRGFQFPILAMYGDHSQARLTGAELLQLWPHAQFRRVPDAGHFFPTSKAEEVIHGCQRFWDGEFAAQPQQRSGEATQRHFRSDRVFESGGAWYGQTREQARIGPFAAAEEALEGLGRYLAAMALNAAR